MREKKTFFAHKENNNNNSHNNEICSLPLHWFPHKEVRVHCSLHFPLKSIFVNRIYFVSLFSIGKPQDELLHHLRPGSGYGVLGHAVPGQELPQDPHLQAGDQDQAQELHGPARHCQGLHRHRSR